MIRLKIAKGQVTVLPGQKIAGFVNPGETDVYSFPYTGSLLQILALSLATVTLLCADIFWSDGRNIQIDNWKLISATLQISHKVREHFLIGKCAECE